MKKKGPLRITLLDTLKAHRSAKRLNEAYVKPTVHKDKKKEQSRKGCRKWRRSDLG